MTALQLVWYLLLVLLSVGYAVLDGFDLGVGVWLPLAGGDRRRRAVVEAIAPVWDGNEVWLLAAAGASFAAFPPVYAALFSGLYPVMMLLIFCLIFRAVAIGLATHEPSGLLRLGWHLVMSAASLGILFLLGLVVGNLLHGVPLDAKGNFVGSRWELLNPLAIVVGLLSVEMMASHGALYLAMRVKGDLSDWARRKASTAWGASVALTVIAFGLGFAARTDLTAPFRAHPALWLLPVLTLCDIVLIGYLNLVRLPKAAFAASVAGILGLLLTAVVSIFPQIVPATDRALSLTIATSSSTHGALLAMLIVAIIGMPVVLGYTAYVYWLFRAPVSAEEGEGEYAKE